VRLRGRLRGPLLRPHGHDNDPDCALERYRLRRQAARPNPAANNVLTAVAAISASNAWAAGAGENGSILQHWNDTAWK